MRLIDADKLKYEAELCRETTDAFKELIDRQPDCYKPEPALISNKPLRFSSKAFGCPSISKHYRRDKEMLKVFISQPMNGRSEQEIKQEREQIISNLTERYGEIDVLDSYFEDYNPENGCVPMKYLAKSIELLADADIAYFAYGWEEARGCRIENQCAIEYGIALVIENYNKEDRKWTKRIQRLS